MLKNIWQAPESTVLGIMICLTVVAIAAMLTDNSPFLRDLLMLVAGGAVTGGALAGGKP